MTGAPRLEDSVAGMEIVRVAATAFADGRDEEALAGLAGATQGEVTWACAYLLATLREATANEHGRNPRKTRAAFRRALEGINEDLVQAQVALIVNAAAT